MTSGAASQPTPPTPPQTRPEDQAGGARISPGHGEPSRLVGPAWLRWLLIVTGWLAFALGVVGVFVPLLPTTPLILLAAACWARSSTRFHRWLRDHRIFGPTLRQWEDQRTIPKRAKVLAIAMIVLTLTPAIVWVVPLWHAQVLLALIGLAVVGWLLSVPSRR